MTAGQQKHVNPHATRSSSTANPYDLNRRQSRLPAIIFAKQVAILRLIAGLLRRPATVGGDQTAGHVALSVAGFGEKPTFVATFRARPASYCCLWS
jgi:hypothetical protein